ncbi:MAG TPA: DUF2332 family protein [Actinomycetes bacterium]
MTAPLAERLRDQAAECTRLGSPLYAGLLARAAEDLEAGGVVAEVFAGHEDLPGRVAGKRHLLLAEAEGHGPPVRWWPPEGSAVIPAAR